MVVSDIRMPGGDGSELLVSIKKFNPLTPRVIFITGYADLPLEEAYQQGTEAIILKPFQRKET